MDLSISAETLKEHIRKFSPSLKLFPDVYVPLFFENKENLPKHLPYLCPLCLDNRLLFTEIGFYKTTDFDIDHFPPQSVEGKDFVLVCIDCNNKAGTEYDFVLKQQAEYRAFQRGHTGSEMKVFTEISNLKGKFKSKLKLNPEGILEMGLKPNGKKVPPLDEWLEKSKGSNDWTITLTYYQPKPDLLRKALVKSAYLYCFAHWGYDFVLSLTGEKMRAVLRGEIEYPFPDVAPFWIDDIPGIPEGVCVMQKDEWQSYVVNMPLVLKSPPYKLVAVVLVPAPGPKGWDHLSSFKNIMESWDQMEVQFTSIKSDL